MSTPSISTATGSTRQRTEPLGLKFIITSLPVGGAETLLLNLVRGLDRSSFSPEVICLKEPGSLGEQIAKEVPLHANLLRSKWDLRIVSRLKRIFRESNTDAVITIGAGDKMFWGRISARLAGIPVICSALHSTGWPDGVGRLNRLLSPITDGFIACAKNHADHLVNGEGFPADRVFMVPNGVDVNRFRPDESQRDDVRDELNLDRNCPIVGIVAALRPEKNHPQFISAAREVIAKFPDAQFLIVGDGPQRKSIGAFATELGIASHVHFLGNRNDTQRLLAAFDVFCLTSKNEANPVSIIEALATGIPVVSPDVGSVRETVLDSVTGFVTRPRDANHTAESIVRILSNSTIANSMGGAGRELVRESWSLEAMVSGYEHLVTSIYNQKMLSAGEPTFLRPPTSVAAGSDKEYSGVSNVPPVGNFQNSQFPDSIIS